MTMSFARRMARWGSVAALAACTMPALAGVSIGVTVHPPGAWGRIAIGPGLPLPPVMLPQPVIVAPTPVSMHAQPVYLYVPPGHQRDWRRHCHHYGACNQHVYFVRDEWVRDRWERHHHHGHRKPPPVHAGRYGRGHDDDRHGHRGRGRGHGYDDHGPRGRGH